MTGLTRSQRQDAAVFCAARCLGLGRTQAGELVRQLQDARREREVRRLCGPERVEREMADAETMTG